MGYSFSKYSILGHLSFFVWILSGYALMELLLIGRDANPFSPLTWVGVCVFSLGFAFLVKAKWPQIRKFDLISFGPKSLPQKNQETYKKAYLAILTGILLVSVTRFL